MTIALSKAQIQAEFSRQAQLRDASLKPGPLTLHGSVLTLHQKGPGIPSTVRCAFCGMETRPGADMHRACWNLATPKERQLVLDAQLEVRAALSEVPVKEARRIYRDLLLLHCQACGRQWRLFIEGWECPACVNI